MATTCELVEVFEESFIDLHEMFLRNIKEASRWGTRYDLIKDDQHFSSDNMPVRQFWGFSSAYALTDGLGGHVSFVVKLTAHKAGDTEITVTVASPYEKRDRRSAYYKRNHKVALRLLEFCIAPYSEIHPHLGRIQQFTSTILSNTASGTAT
jgi:hypothetical protein